MPAAIVLAKADTLRFEPVIARWLARQEETGELSSREFHEESRDVYAYLQARKGGSWLSPYHRFSRCTLHVVSATGSEIVGTTYSRGLRPRRVLQPLVAILAMAGVIGSPEADWVGR
jgi:hypothetical protein